MCLKKEKIQLLAFGTATTNGTVLMIKKNVLVAVIYALYEQSSICYEHAEAAEILSALKSCN